MGWLGRDECSTHTDRHRLIITGGSIHAPPGPTLGLLLILLVGCEGLPQATPAARKRPCMTGVFLGDKDLAAGYEAYVQLTGTRPQLLLTFVPWVREGGLPFPANFCGFARDRGAIPIITWEPWDPQTDWHPLLEDIAAGRHDAHLREWADAGRQWRLPILLRFAHEMNGSWYPWCERKNPLQTASSYVAAWRRIREVFRQAGAENIQFVWAPNFEPAEHLERYWPGSGDVDWVGVDLYNQPAWARNPAEMLRPILQFAKQRGKPVILTEVGCAETPPASRPVQRAREWAAKPHWIEQLFASVAQEPCIRGLVWFEVEKEADWRIASSSASVVAFRRGLLRLDSKELTNR